MFLAIAFIVLLGFFKVGARAWYESWGSFEGDAGVYGAVGRGILNGLTPYVDLFEIKTPLVFLFFALSFLVTGSMQLLSWTLGAMLFLFPFAMVLPLLLRFGRRTDPVAALLAFIIGCALSLFIAANSGQLLVEAFGAFFAALLIGLLFAFDDAQPQTWLRFSVVTVLLLLTLGVKEPFLLSVIGAAILLLPLRRTARALALPFVTLAVVGFAFMLLTGLLVPYFTVYIGYMTGHHLEHPWGTLGVPIWFRFINVVRVWKNAGNVSPALPWVFLILWIGALVTLVQGAATRRDRVSAVLRWLAGTVLTTAAVGLTGDFHKHHFVFAVPFFASCFFVCILAKKTAFPKLRMSAASAIVLLCGILFALAPFDFRSVYAEWQESVGRSREAAERADLILDRCGVDRYFFFVDRIDPFLAFTRHSPLGPIFTQYSRMIGARPEFLEGFAEALAIAPIMVMRTDNEGIPMTPESLAALRSAFTVDPPACAGSLIPPAPYRILYRKNS